MPVLFIGQRESPRFFAERAEYHFGLSGLDSLFGGFNQGRRASRLPLAIIFRAFGAVGAEISSHKQLY
jgi:hypothetical protein